MGADDRELTLTRDFDLPAHKLYRCWTEPELLKRWFAPRPLTTPVVEVDVRPGGAHKVLMRGEDGTEYPASGVYLEVIPGRKLVFTDAYGADWTPSAKPFFTGVVTFEDLGGGRSRYTARALHWTREDAQAHVQMGFHQGWGQCADQMAEVAATL